MTQDEYFELLEEQHNHDVVISGAPSKIEEQWWVFTFGSGQQHAGHYVKFYGTYSSARHKMVDKFGLEWAFQYSEEEWNKTVKAFTDKGMAYLLETELTEND